MGLFAVPAEGTPLHRHLLQSAKEKPPCRATAPAGD